MKKESVEKQKTLGYFDLIERHVYQKGTTENMRALAGRLVFLNFTFIFPNRKDCVQPNL